MDVGGACVGSAATAASASAAEASASASASAATSASSAAAAVADRLASDSTGVMADGVGRLLVIPTDSLSPPAVVMML